MPIPAFRDGTYWIPDRAPGDEAEGRAETFSPSIDMIVQLAKGKIAPVNTILSDLVTRLYRPLNARN